MRLRQIGAAVLVCALALANTAAEARKASHHGQGVITCDMRGCSDVRTAEASAPAAHAHRHARAARSATASTSRACLTHDTRAILEAAEAHFGVTFKLVSTCRPGAIIAGTNHPSEHRYGKAVDLLPPRGMKARVVRWLYAHAPGVTMIYARMPHVHFDTGPYHALACGGCGRPKRTHLAHLP